MCVTERQGSVWKEKILETCFLLEAISIIMNACVSTIIAESWSGNKCMLLKAKFLVCEALGNYVKTKCITQFSGQSGICKYYCAAKPLGSPINSVFNEERESNYGILLPKGIN